MLGVSVNVGVREAGWKGVSVIVGVNVSVKVGVMVRVWLLVAVKMPRVSVALGVTGVTVGVAVGALGSGANWTAIHPMQ